MADIPLGRRIVKCPNCLAILVEPGFEIYECPECCTCLKAKRTPPDLEKNLVKGSSGESNGSQQTNQQEASILIDSKPKGQDQSNIGEKQEHTATGMSISLREQVLEPGTSENILVFEKGRAEDSQLQSKFATSASEDIAANGEEGRVKNKNVPLDCTIDKEAQLADAAEVSRALVMQQDCLQERDAKVGLQLLCEGETLCNMFAGEPVSGETTEKKVRDASSNDCGKPSVTQENVSTVKDLAVEGPHQEERVSHERKDENPQSEIIRDNDRELSFKYISSGLKSNGQLARKKRTHRLAKFSSEALEGEDKVAAVLDQLSSSSSENLDDFESCSASSETPTNDGTDSDFDFPAPSAENTQSAKLFDSFLQENKPPSGVDPEGPHQLEWQDAYYPHEVATCQDLNGSTNVSAGVCNNIAFGVLIRGEEGLGEDGVQCIEALAKKTTSRGCDDTVADALYSSSVQGVNKPSGSEVLANNGILATVAMSAMQTDNKEASFIDSVDKPKPKQSILTIKLLDSSSPGTEQISQLQQYSNPKGPMQSAVINTYTSSSSGLSQLETCSTVQEHVELIKSVANGALMGTGTTSLHDNVEDERFEWLAVEAIVDTGGDGINAPFSQMKELESGGMQSALKIEQGNYSNQGAISLLGSRGHNSCDGSQNELHKELHVQNREKFAKTTSAKSRYQTKNSAQVLNQKDAVLGNTTHAVKGKIHNEDIYLSRSATTLEAHVQADHMSAGPSLQPQNTQEDLYSMEQTFHTVEAHKVFPARLSSQPFRCNNHCDGLGSFANTSCSYQAPSCPLMLPMAMPGHACGHCSCPPVGQFCLPYVHCQHSHMPQVSMPTCLHCLRTVGCQQVHTTLGNYPQSYQVQASCMASHSPTSFPPQIANVYGTPMASTKPLMSSIRKPKYYPPLPQRRSAPYVVCRGCTEFLEVPANLPPSNGAAQKLRCSACGKVSKFSLPQSVEKSYQVGFKEPPVEPTWKAATSSPFSFDFMVQKREVPATNVGQNFESLCGEYLPSRYGRGSISSRHYSDRGASPVTSNNNLHHSLQNEEIFKLKSNGDEADAMVPTTNGSHSSQDEFFFRSLSRKSEFDSSRSVFNGFKTMPTRFGVGNVVDDGFIESGHVNFQSSVTVDEKEEGLDFGAPRPSDGESLDQRSPESRMRSPENLTPVKEARHRRHSFGDEEAWATTNEQQFGSNFNSTSQGKKQKPSNTLIALLHQESTKFTLNLEERVCLGESGSTLSSPASNSPVCGHKNMKFNARKERALIRDLMAQKFVRKGPQYIASMLRRSLRNRGQ